MTTYDNLRSANRARQKEWDPNGELSLSYKANELAGEIGEVCNGIKKIERARLGLKGSTITHGELEDEFADVVICLDLLADRLGINLSTATQRKFNATSEALGFTTRVDLGDY